MRYVMLELLDTGKELTIGLVGAGRAADRAFIDYRNNIATFTKALSANISVQLIYLFVIHHYPYSYITHTRSLLF